MSITPTQKIARYTLTVYLDLPIYEDDDPQAYLTPKAKTQLERNVIHIMRTLDGDGTIDCEVIAAIIVDEEK